MNIAELLKAIPPELVFALAGFAGLILPLRIAWIIMSAMVFVPLFRVEVPISAIPVGLRPEDLLIVILAIRCATSRHKTAIASDIRPLASLYGLILLINLTSFILSLSGPRGSEVAFYTIQKIVGVTGMFYIALHTLRSPKDLFCAILGPVIGGIILSLVVITSGTAHASTLGHANTARYEFKQSNAKELESFNANGIGVDTGALASVCAGFLASRIKGGKSRKVLAGLLFALFIVVLLLSYTRSAMVAFVATMAFLTYSLRRRLGLVVAVVIVVVFACMLALGFGLNVASVRFTLQTDEAVDNGADDGGRFEKWQAGLNALQENPFGYGVGLGDTGITRWNGRRDSAHNDYIDIALDTGFTGLLLFIIAFYKFYILMRKARAAAPDIPLAYPGELLCVFFFVTSFAMQALNYMKQPYILLAGCMAVANVILLQRKSSRRILRMPSSPKQGPQHLSDPTGRSFPPRRTAPRITHEQTSEFAPSNSIE